MQIQSDYPLRSLNTFGIAATAGHFAVFRHDEELRELLTVPAFRENPLILGGGSNILLTRNPGAVLKNEISGIRRVGEDGDDVYVQAGAGESWHGFVMYCMAEGLAGVENLSLIPGSVGAAPMQNIGAYGVEVREVFHSLEALDLQDGSLATFTAQDCAFGYRESVFKNRHKGRYAILRVTFRLHRTPRFNTSYGAIAQELEAMGVQELSLRAVSDAVIRIRRAKLPDPGEIGNAGSFFKNPEVSAETCQRLKAAYPQLVAYPLDKGYKLAAGWLIESCGWKGYREGDAGVHTRQALVLVNYGQASGDALYRLSEKIRESVQQKFGVLLEREVNIV